MSTAAFTKIEEKGPPGDGREEIHHYDGEQREAATGDTRENMRRDACTIMYVSLGVPQPSPALFVVEVLERICSH